MKLIELTEASVDVALKRKAKQSKVDMSTLRAVFNHGLAAYKTSHRPGTTAPQWAFARVNSFLAGGKARKSDQDLWDARQLLEGKDDVNDCAKLYVRWKQLVNMSASELKAFKASQTDKGSVNAKDYPGLKPKEAASLGISSGVQSARWILKMKATPNDKWTSEMWTWARKQISFISRMLGNKGPLHDEHGQPTRKLLSLKIWGHDPNQTVRQVANSTLSS